MTVQTLLVIHGKTAHSVALMMMVMDGRMEKTDSSMIHLNGTMLMATDMETILEAPILIHVLPKQVTRLKAES